MKVAHVLEASGAPYRAIPVDTRTGDRFQPECPAINSNAKVPVTVDDDAAVCDRNTILLHHADKTGPFMPPPSAEARGESLSSLMFLGTGRGPFPGQVVHFEHFAPGKIPCAIDRDQSEAECHSAVRNAHRAKRRDMVGNTSTIVDME
jgi:GST-like protein